MADSTAIMTSNPRQPELSIVATVFNAEASLSDFVERCWGIANELTSEGFEIVLVDDHSSDDSLSVALAARERLAGVAVVELARNYGQHLALLAGVRCARGKLVFCMDGDGEEDPNWIAGFLEAHESTGADLVIGSNNLEKKSFLYRRARSLFIRVLGLRDLKSHNETTARLMTRQVADALTQHTEVSFYFGGIMHDVGFKRKHISVSKPESHPTRYTFKRRVRQVSSAITSFSTVPLRLLLLWGLLVSTVALTGFAAILTLTLVGKLESGGGWTSILLTVTFFGGNILCGLGLLGEYVSTVVRESKRRPQYHVRRFHEVRL